MNKIINRINNFENLSPINIIKLGLFLTNDAKITSEVFNAIEKTGYRVRLNRIQSIENHSIEIQKDFQTSKGKITVCLVTFYEGVTENGAGLIDNQRLSITILDKHKNIINYVNSSQDIGKNTYFKEIILAYWLLKHEIQKIYNLKRLPIDNVTRKYFLDISESIESSILFLSEMSKMVVKKKKTIQEILASISDKKSSNNRELAA